MECGIVLEGYAGTSRKRDVAAFLREPKQVEQTLE